MAMTTTGSAELDNLRDEFNTFFNSINTRKARVVLDARGKYDAALDILITSYTIAGDHDAANMAYSERLKLETRPEITEAKAVEARENL